MKSRLAISILCAAVLAASNAHAQTDSGKPAAPVVSNGTACKHNLERFVVELDAVMAQEHRNIFRYTNLLRAYLDGVSKPDASVMGCKIDEALEIAKRSKFFFEADGPPRGEHYTLEFRNSLAIVAFGIHRDTGNILGPYTRWIRYFP